MGVCNVGVLDVRGVGVVPAPNIYPNSTISERNLGGIRNFEGELISVVHVNIRVDDILQNLNVYRGTVSNKRRSRVAFRPYLSKTCVRDLKIKDEKDSRDT